MGGREGRRERERGKEGEGEGDGWREMEGGRERVRTTRFAGREFGAVAVPATTTATVTATVTVTVTTTVTTTVTAKVTTTVLATVTATRRRAATSSPIAPLCECVHARDVSE